MKTFINKSKIILALLAVTLLAGTTACNVSEPDLPFDLDGTLNNNGAYLRVLETTPFDVAEGANATFSLTVEYYDGKDNPLLEDVRFYADYTAFSLDPDNDPEYQEVDETESAFHTVPASAFSENDKGNLQATIEIQLSTVLDALGLTISDIEVEDNFGIRWELNTTDGRTFSTNDRSTAVAGGFYSSPYFSSVNTVQAIPTNLFTGEYEFTLRENGVYYDVDLGGIALQNLFGQTFTAELTVDPDNSLNGRVFSREAYPNNILTGSGDKWTNLGPVEVPLAFGQTASVQGAVSIPLSCGAGIAFGPARSDLELIDINDDSEFTLVISENINTDCGLAPGNIIYDAVKQ